MSLRDRSQLIFAPLLLLFASAALALLTCFLYGRHDFIPAYFYLWIASIALAAAAYYPRRPRQQKTPRWDHRDLWIALGLLLFFAPFYFAKLYDIPLQMTTDEIYLSSWARWVTLHTPDPFGVGYYWFMPNLVYLLYGKFCLALGSIDFFHMRIANAFTGLAAIAVSYGCFRLMGLEKRVQALGAALLLGSQHVMVALSRMALWQMTPLVTGFPGLALLFDGHRRQSPWRTFWGGVLMGLGFYVYYPSKIYLLIWAVYVFITAFILRRRAILKLLPAACAGFVLTVAPLTVGMMKARTGVRHLAQYQSDQLLLSAPSNVLRENIRNGLCMFNKPIICSSLTYRNPGHGFLDPLSGILLWIGFLILLWRCRRDDAARLIAVGFFLSWMLFTFLIGGAPNYCRMIIILPLIAIMIFVALDAFPSTVSLAPFVIPILMYWNGSIFLDHYFDGVLHGDVIGVTLRYVDARRNNPRQAYEIVADNDYRYYLWHDSDTWRFNVEAFAGPGQTVAVCPPEDLLSHLRPAPVTYFMDRRLWRRYEPDLRRHYPLLQLYSIQDRESSLVAVEARELPLERRFTRPDRSANPINFQNRSTVSWPRLKWLAR